MTKPANSFFSPRLILSFDQSISMLAMIRRTKFYLTLALAILALSACNYDGISGSSGSCPPELSGLWVQNEQSVIVAPRNDGQAVTTPNCACWGIGADADKLQRCYSYFSNGRVVSGSLTRPEASANNCAATYEPSPEDRAKLIAELEKISRERPVGLASIRPGLLTFAVGSCEFHGNGPVESGGTTGRVGANNENTGRYLDIVYPGGAATPLERDRICSAYNLQGDKLFLATEPSSGRIPQPPETCRGEDRYIQLIDYSKF